jgi:hypothetical protein
MNILLSFPCLAVTRLAAGLRTARIVAGGALLLGCAFALTACAEEVHYDVLVTSQGGKLVIGGYDDGLNAAIAPLNVFGGESLGLGTLDPYLSDGEPGFRAVSQAFLNDPAKTDPAGVYTALSGTTNLTFTFQPITIGATTRNLFFWDGVGGVDFSPLTAGYALSLQKSGFGGWTRTITGTSAGVVTGATIQETGADGAVHQHLVTEIADNGAGPATGFYLFSLQFQMNGFTPSDNAYFVFGAYDAENPPDLVAFEAAHGAAELWVENNLVAVPEPSSVALAGLGVAGALAAGWRRRRRAAAANPPGAKVGR